MALVEKKERKKERKKVNSLSHVQLFVDPMDCSLPGSSVHGIFQARVLEWGAISYSRGSSRPGSPTLQADALPSEPPGKPQWKRICLQCRRHRFDPWVGKSPPRGGHSNPLQYSCLENTMDRGAWRATVHGVHKELEMTEAT